MNSPAVPLADVVVTESDIDAVVDVYRSGWLSMGPRTIDFEQTFAEYVGTKFALATSSGTAALHLMCAALGLGSGDEVIVPSLTFVASVNVIAYTGASPVFADVASLEEPWLSAADVEQRITERTRAVMAVHYGGHAGELLELQALCERRDLVLLEDAAHAAGSRLAGRHLGTFGRAGAFSLFSNKNLAVGEGGVLVSDDQDLIERARLLRSHGMTTLTWDRHRGHASTYDVVAQGFNYRLDEPRAALASARLARLDQENQQRAKLRDNYATRCRELGLSVLLDEPEDLMSSHHLFVVVLPNGLDRDLFRVALSERGVQTSVHYPPAHLMSAYADETVRLPITEEFARRALTLPLFAHMTEQQVDHVIAACADAIGAQEMVATASEQ